MAVVMLVLLATILGSIAIANRTTSGLEAARSQSRNREARDIAESGVTEIISELNKEPNRKLLILPRNSWGSSETNPCSAINTNGASVTPIPTPTTRALGYFQTWQNLNNTDSTKQFQLESAVATKIDRTTLLTSTVEDAQSQGTEKTLFKLTVTGRIRDNAGNLISSATITREFEVVPKCCKRSFGANSYGAKFWGKDGRECLPGSTGGLGIVVGIKGGYLDSSNAPFTNIVDQNNIRITRVLCAKDEGNSSCDNQSLTLGNSISVVPTTFDTNLPAYPGSSTAGVLDARTRSYIRINNSTTPPSVQQCRPDLSDCASLSNSICEIINSQAWCKLTGLNIQNNVPTIIDTSNGRINWYFTGNGIYGNKSPLNYTASSNSGLAHVNCSPGLTICSTNAGLSKVEEFNVFISGTGAFELKGSSSALAINLFNEYGTTTMNGGPNYIGRIWSNSLVVKGNAVSLQVPLSSPSQFCTAVSCPATVSSGSPATDWVARSITQSSNF